MLPITQVFLKFPKDLGEKLFQFNLNWIVFAKWYGENFGINNCPNELWSSSSHYFLEPTHQIFGIQMLLFVKEELLHLNVGIINEKVEGGEISDDFGLFLDGFHLFCKLFRFPFLVFFFGLLFSLLLEL